jgi:hypothetical protein
MTTSDDPRTRFLTLLDAALADDRLVKLLLSGPLAGAEPGLERVLGRRVVLRGQPHLSLVDRYTTKDITKNLPLDAAHGAIDALLGGAFRHAHLQTLDREAQLTFSKKGKPLLSVQRTTTVEPSAGDAHNREKQRWLPIESAFLTALGVTTAQHQLVPAMARKWKQINKFLEVFAGALAASACADADTLHVADFGSGKGYLTFAVHQWLRTVKGVRADVTGVELRPDMVALCNGVIRDLALEGLHIEQGDVRQWQPRALDVVIALHACDIATDHAIHLGIRAGAEIILCSPCCHKQVRPQLLSPHPLRPILQHGIHADQQAEMLTDGLRALLLEAAGYDTKVFEFVSLEHTNKNKMILAVKRRTPRPAEPVLQQIDELKRFYGVREQALESLLKSDGLLPA